MGLGLFGAPGLGITAIYEYSKTPVEPAPEKKAPEKEVSIDELIKSLTPKKDDPKVARKREEVPGKAEAALAYMDEITKLYRCSAEFARKVGAEIEDASGEAARIEKLRGQIEEIAKRPDHGASYVRSAVAFTCDALSQPAIIKLKADEQTKSVFLPTLNFHLKRWGGSSRRKRARLRGGSEIVLIPSALRRVCGSPSQKGRL